MSENVWFVIICSIVIVLCGFIHCYKMHKIIKALDYEEINKELEEHNIKLKLNNIYRKED